MSTPTETWRTLAAAPRYEVSDLGRVRSTVRSAEPRVLALRLNSSGYPHVLLSTDDGPQSAMVHALVAEAFIGPRPAGMDVCHNDGDRANNRLSNLRYGTRSENVLDSVRHGTHPMASKTHCSNGHEFTAENTRRDGNGHRVCVTCSIEKTRRWRRRQEEGATDA